MTGRYPHRNGTTTFKPHDPDVITLPEILAGNGYRLGLMGKTGHTLPQKHDVFDTVIDGAALQGGRNPELYESFAGRFIADSEAADRPFFLNINLHDPHRPFAGSPPETGFEERVQALVRRVVQGAGLADDIPGLAYWGHPSVSARHDEADVYIPGFLPDLPEIRAELATYQTSVKRADETVGRIFDLLDRQGVRENTVFVFLTDNGIHMPFAKANLYPFSTRAALSVVWPQGGFDARVDREAFVSSIDIMPTLLDLLGIAKPPYLDGSSFLDTLTASGKRHRDGIFTQRHSFPMRAYQDGVHSYIFNEWADGETPFQAFFLDNPSANAMREAARDDPAIQRRWDLFVYRTREELYDLKRDPWCLNNLAEESSMRETLARYRDTLKSHLASSDDNLRAAYEAFVDGESLSSRA
jgi:N-sulfoglucosamine sulfohydrolase